MKRLYKIGLLAALLIIPLSAGAQQAQVCETTYESIVTLFRPHLGVPSLWDALYNRKDGLVQFSTGLARDGGTVTAAGRVISPADMKSASVVLVEMNNRGRVVTEKTFPAHPGENPVKLQPSGKGYILASQIRGGAHNDRMQVRLSWYGAQSDYKSEKIIADDTQDYEIKTLVPTVDGEGYVVVIHAMGRGVGAADESAVLIRIANDGRQIWRRVYNAGAASQISNLQKLNDKNGAYLALGRMEISPDRMAAWVMKLDKDGSIVWQRTYPRGAYAEFTQAVPSGEGLPELQGYYLAGTTKPYGGGGDATMFMAVDALGETLWQRYFTRKDLAFSPIGLTRVPDGRFILPLNAAAVPGSGARGHVRVLTLSPRGIVLLDEAYIEGVEARAEDFQYGPHGERIVLATVESDSSKVEVEMVGDTMLLKTDPAAPADSKKPPQSKGWIMIGAPLDPYVDPCLEHRTAP